ncbi:MAG: hypothetical protein CMC13_06695 [Flavobacteriaceae bacterium]|nr:hypothetical protein [Flavobacteriaceae bacterium]|tara:strand:+ start:1572 stop:2360 length:789 start_codon:yes stop_codon:yes gene_type:complete
MINKNGNERVFLQACKIGDFERLENLINQDPHFDIDESTKKEGLLICLDNRHQKAMLFLMAKYPPSQTYLIKLFYRSCSQGLTKIVEFCLKQNSLYLDNKVKDYFVQAIYNAAHIGCFDTVKILLDTDFAKNIPLGKVFALFCQYGLLKYVKLLNEEFQVDIKFWKKHGFIIACEFENLEVITYLLDKVGISNSFVREGFDRAYKVNAVKSADFLLKRGFIKDKTLIQKYLDSLDGGNDNHLGMRNVLLREIRNIEITELII